MFMASAPLPECHSALAEGGSLIASIRNEVGILHAGGQADERLLAELEFLLTQIESELGQLIRP